MSDQQQKSPADYVTEGDGFADITLSRPAAFGGAVNATARMREPTVDEMVRHQESKESEAKKEVRIFADLCGATAEEIGKLPFRDYIRLQAAFALFTN